MPVLPLSVPKIESYGCPVRPRIIRLAHRLGRNSLVFTACSASCARAGMGFGRWEVIYNGIPLTPYHFSNVAAPEKYLAFLGRLDRIKGVHTAIQVAKATGKGLIIAGNVASEGANKRFFEQEVRPLIDGDQIQYIGPVNDGQKNELLRGAQALLFPIEWEEPFGLVMIEAMACGTPVIAYDRGAVREVVQDGVNGFVCTSLDEMISATSRLEQIDRKQCRNTVETRFSQDVIVSRYEQLYSQLVTESPKWRRTSRATKNRHETDTSPHVVAQDRQN